MSRSARRREFANTIVERCASTSSRIAASTCGHTDPDPDSVARSDRSSTGTVTRMSNRLPLGGATMLTGRVPARKRATSSRGRTVADSPMRCTGAAVSSSRRSSDSARCAPRFVPASAWISSTMTVSTPRSVSRAADVSMRNSDSGVVMRISGGCATSERRSAGSVSPERTPTLTSGTSRPWAAAVRAMPTSGARRLRSTSTPSAFSGER